MNSIVFIDIEVNPQNNKILDLGAVKSDNSKFHSSSQSGFSSFVFGSEFICGHNIIAHDLKYISDLVYNINDIFIIDTLCISPLLFPNRPYHALLKDDKLQSDELNNPLNDSIKAMELFFDEVNVFERLKPSLKEIYFLLLHRQEQFSGFFNYIKFQSNADAETLIKNEFCGKICDEAELSKIIKRYPIELAYCLALISTDDRFSITPPWVHKNYPVVENVMKLLRSTPCANRCGYCNSFFDVRIRLKDIFGYDEFRKYNGEPLQEKAAEAAVNNRSLLAIFPTGGGKSITFQLPALIAGETSRGLTVVISPLQSLMKDQVDNLSALGIADAVTVNGLLNPIERAEAFARVESGLATILYISPESLRSKTIEKLLSSRNVIRFVIDEAHCFSAWGQDFRVDYQYIGDFIKELQKIKNLTYSIPVSCFTATAKQKVISDIRDYFKQKLNIELELYTTNAARDNLRYELLYKETDNEKYVTLRDIISQRNCPTIVYVSRTKRTFEIAQKLTSDGFSARPFNGKMVSSEKVANQEDFIAGKVQIIVATSAFGMGVDKKDVKLVIHYDISDSLENYVQEAGRAGRDQSLQAECYILFNDNDLDKHFILLNQTKLSISEIQQVWKAIKDLTRTRNCVCRSPLEIARQSGWDETVSEIETRVKTAVSALETAGYITRGKNIPKIYATSILAKNMEEASEIINSSHRFNDIQKQNASRIIKLLISSRSKSKAGNDDAESRIDYISDLLGIPKFDILSSINIMREEGLLNDSKDLTAYLRREDNKNKSLAILQKFIRLEAYLISIITSGVEYITLNEINDSAEKANIKDTSVKSIKTLLYYWTIKNYIRKTLSTSEKHVAIVPEISLDLFNSRYTKRVDLAQSIIKYLYDKSSESLVSEKEESLVLFSVLELKNAYSKELTLFKRPDITFEDVEDALLYLAKIGSLNLEGGFLVLYNAMEIKRIELDNRIRYKNDDYRQLNEYYKQKVQQIHIVGEYANMMVRDYDEALQFVSDYFQMDYKQFIAKYFKGTRFGEINRNITPAKYKQLYDGLSTVQAEIINDDKSKYIAVTAGPGSGKTRVLVHKLASLLMLEDVKQEQLLMLTFSRAAATEFKKRLVELIGNAANFIEIKTFHSYCFDLLGKIGNLESSDKIVKNAVEMINSGEAETGRITKTVVVIDEAQDMDENEYALIKALMSKNEEMRVLAVGDDDQNIYEFRGSSSKYLKSFITDNGAEVYELLENYRSKRNIVEFSNLFSSTISQRLKSQPTQPVQQENGIVRLTKHVSQNLETPIVNNIKSSHKNGTVCVLTNTNEDALKVTGLLTKEGFKARLIQSNDGFNLYNLAELRGFLKTIDKETTSPIISDEAWETAKNRLQSVYKQSECLTACLNLLSSFEQTNKKKYRTDLELFIRESRYEDFYNTGQGEILVSTIHKSKGREFDSVYMLMNNVTCNNDESRRKIYVALTRAKNELYIHYNNDCFDRFHTEASEKSVDNTIYPEPEEIITQLSHSDVYLDFFKDKKSTILNLRSGYELTIKETSLLYESPTESVTVSVFSKKYKQTITTLKNKGYKPFKAKIRFIVAWKPESGAQDTAILLSDIYYKT